VEYFFTLCFELSTLFNSSDTPQIPQKPTIFRRKKMAAVRFTTIPCERYAANKVQGLSHIFALFVPVSIVYAGFEDFDELFCTFL